MEKGSSSSSSSAGAYAGPDGLCLGLRPKTGAAPPKKGRCQVEGCNLDLSDAKPYYSRHKVCGPHSKTPKVIVAGIEQRFCQQCSRFHRLPEFDQGKRSCRRRLAGHNERRRKPPQGCKNFHPTGFDNNHITKTGGFVMALSPHSSFSAPSPEQGLATNRAAITGKYELPLQSNSAQNHVYDLLACRPISSMGPVVSSQECFNGVPTNGVSDSSNALSLLSSQPWPGPKIHLGVNSFQDNNHGSTVGYFVCSPWNFKGNEDLGPGQASEPGYAGLGLGQAREYDSPSVGHLMHRSI